MTDPNQVRQSISKVKHPWTKAKLTEIFELTLPLVEEYDGQGFAAYDSDDFARKCIPILEAMITQKTGKKLFLGLISNALVGITNTMSFFWWTPTRLMGKKDLQLMSNHLEQLKERLQKSAIENVTVATSSLNISNDQSVAERSQEIAEIEKNWEQIRDNALITEENAHVIDDFDSSDGETDMAMAKIQTEAINSSLEQNCSQDDNGNMNISFLPRPSTKTSTPKTEVKPPSQKRILQELRRSIVEKTRFERQDTISDSRASWASLLKENESDDENEKCLHLQISLKNTGGINY